MAFLGIRVTHEVGRLLSSIEVPGKRVAASDMHITLLGFADNWPISELVNALKAAYDVVSTSKPFLVKTQRISCFTSKANQSAAIVARIESLELHKIHDKLAESFDKEKIDFCKDFKDYNPHISLSYNDKAIEEFEFEEVEFSVPELVLWGGDHGDDRVFITFPLQGPKKQKCSIVAQQADICEKLANNPPQNHLTASYERRKEER